MEDIQSFVNVYAIAKRTGGNLEQVLHNTAARLRDKMEVMEEIEACIAAKKMEEKIMGCMPCGIILYLRLLSPGFLGSPVWKCDRGGCDDCLPGSICGSTSAGGEDRGY